MCVKEVERQAPKVCTCNNVVVLSSGVCTLLNVGISSPNDPVKAVFDGVKVSPVGHILTLVVSMVAVI